MNMKKEAKARIKINKLLEEAGWRFFDGPDGPATISVETSVKIEEAGDDFEKVSQGYVDYLLSDEKGFPICVLEAKSEEKEPLVGKEQARDYANSENVRFVILSNGNIHYFWDLETGNPQIITKFPTSESLGTRKKYEPNKKNLIKEILKISYILRNVLSRI